MSCSTAYFLLSKVSQGMESPVGSSQPRLIGHDSNANKDSHSHIPLYGGHAAYMPSIGGQTLSSLTPEGTLVPMASNYGALTQAYQQTSQPNPRAWLHQPQISQGHYPREPDSPSSQEQMEYTMESPDRRGSDRSSGAKYHTQRKPSNRDEFDGPHQLLNPPSPRALAGQERELPHLPTNLDIQEQDDILAQVNEILSKCAYDFVARYQFPIPLEPDKRQVRVPSDREWTEWVYLLKRLATKRRIPARVLYHNQIKQLVTILENSLEMRHAATHQTRPVKDDRNVLQLISAGTQVAKILKDPTAMERLSMLYIRTDNHIQERLERNRRGFMR